MKLGVIMDPIGSINIKKDSTFEMICQAQELGFTVEYMELSDLSIHNGHAIADTRTLTIYQDSHHWYNLAPAKRIQLKELDCILMRKDPPFDMEYIYSTYILERAKQDGCLIANDPQALRDCNEKVYCSWFPQLCPDTLITRNSGDIRSFLAEHKDIIIKPLDGMGGSSIFRITQGSANISVIIETLTNHGQQFTMLQTFIPEITEGDKRVLIVNGKVVPYCLARIPAKGETRGNLAAGGTGVAQPLSESDRNIAEQVAPELLKRQIYFAGLDIIGNNLTEINITSPTCIKEINQAFNTNIAKDLLLGLQQVIGNHSLQAQA